MVGHRTESIYLHSHDGDGSSGWSSMADDFYLTPVCQRRGVRSRRDANSQQLRSIKRPPESWHWPPESILEHRGRSGGDDGGYKASFVAPQVQATDAFRSVRSEAQVTYGQSDAGPGPATVARLG